jgi:hypothetical protein
MAIQPSLSKVRSFAGKYRMMRLSSDHFIIRCINGPIQFLLSGHGCSGGIAWGRSAMHTARRRHERLMLFVMHKLKIAHVAPTRIRIDALHLLTETPRLFPQITDRCYNVCSALNHEANFPFVHSCSQALPARCFLQKWRREVEYLPPPVAHPSRGPARAFEHVRRGFANHLSVVPRHSSWDSNPSEVLSRDFINPVEDPQSAFRKPFEWNYHNIPDVLLQPRVTVTPYKVELVEPRAPVLPPRMPLES